jgi:hypothetical protein
MVLGSRLDLVWMSVLIDLESFHVVRLTSAKWGEADFWDPSYR